MELQYIYTYAIFGILSFTLACSNGEDVIPEAVKPHEPPSIPEYVFNEPDFVPHKEGEPFDSYRGLVMTGYQGWFCAPGSGCSHESHKNTEWYHYRNNEIFEPGPLRSSIDLWPDMREYEVKYSTNSFIHPNGEKAQVYSNYDKSTVMLHFKWMKEYGIDGAFVQRFVGEVIDNSRGKDHFDTVLEHTMEASNTHQRAISVMYDLSGSTPEKMSKVLIDAQDIMEKYQLKDRTKQKFYLHQNEKPLITIWGVGFNDGRSYSLDDVETLMNGLKEKGFSIMLGVPTYWRERRNDALSDLKLHDLIKAADVIMPWFVGRYDHSSYPDFHSLIEQDIVWSNINNVEYAPLCFAGYTFRNSRPNGRVISRNRGQFFWSQIYHTIKSGAQMLYIAMFDEIDEGTAIYKCLNQSDVPSNKPDKDYWVLYKSGDFSIKSSEVTGLTGDDWCKLASSLDVTFQGYEDGLPTDHYLWLTGQGKKMLRGEIQMTPSLPIRE